MTSSLSLFSPFPQVSLAMKTCWSRSGAGGLTLPWERGGERDLRAGARLVVLLLHAIKHMVMIIIST